MEQHNSDMARIYEKGQQSIIKMEFEDTPVIVAPENMKVHVLENLAEKWRDTPIRLQQKIQTYSIDSFLDYYNRHADEDSVIFVDTNQCIFTAILDYHFRDGHGTSARFGEHIAAYTCPQTEEWQSWITNNNDAMDQEQFALFIEERSREIIEPNAAQMLQIATTLKAKQGVKFKQSTRLDNGQTQFLYEEVIDGHAGHNGQLSIPEKIKIQLPIFKLGAQYKLEARFRYRITPSGLKMWYTLINPHTSHDDCINDIVEACKENMTKGHLYHGAAL